MGKKWEWKVTCSLCGYKSQWHTRAVARLLSLWHTLGLGFESRKVYSFGCSGCNVIGFARLDELPPGWEKRYRPDRTHFFLCPKCREQEFEVDGDYVITDENREQAVDEIVGQLFDDEKAEVEIKALRDYANKLLDEAGHWSKYALQASVASYSDGFSDAREANRLGGGHE